VIAQPSIRTEVVKPSYYGVEDAAESRSSGVGTRPGFRFISTGTAGISSGPSAGGAGSSAFSMLAYFAAILCSLV
jgi:hypothetical protein